MEIINFIERHWSDIVLGLGTLATLLGLRAKAAQKQATWQQVEKWANAAADSVLLWLQAISPSIAVDADEIVAKWRERLLEFAAAVGFEVNADHMRKALAIANARIGKVALDHNIIALQKVADAMRHKMNNGALAPITKVERTTKTSTPPPFGEKK